MKILITAFDPFGQDTINPALEIMKALPDKVGEVELIKVEVPTVFNEAHLFVKEVLSHTPVQAVVHLGQAGGRKGITPERIAINLDDARIPDNKGQQPIDQPIQEDGQAAYFSNLPVKAMVDAIKAEGLPAELSNSAGTFVCNHLMYQTLYLLDQTYPGIQAGFIHVPYIEGQGRPEDFTMSLDDMVKGISAALTAIHDFDGKEDLHSVEGQIH